MDELLVIYYTIELLTILHHLHSSNLIHGDVKPDNFLILNDEEYVFFYNKSIHFIFYF